ncbi:MAG: hypothetical protein EBR30_01795 [Cytophagia bacterium]|nr:hypothetical protein [Cytophagia bacterium]
MKQFIIALILVLTVPVYAFSQTIIQTFTDPCTKAVTTFNIPITGATTIIFYNKSRTFTAADVQSGAFNAWIVQVYEEYRKLTPCSATSVTTTQVTANAVSAAVSAAVSSATSSAASSAVSSATSSAASAATSSASSSASSSAAASSSSSSNTSSSSGENSSSSESSSGESSSSEQKSESKSESKGGGSKSGGKGGGKSQAKMNPILFNSDLTAGQTIDNSINLIVTGGMSQSSMAGDVSWGLTGMVWSNLKQFALSGRYTKMHMDEGKLLSISNFGATTVYAFGNVFGFLTYAYIRPLGKWGVTGANMTISVAYADNQMNTTHSLLLFYTKPFPINRRLTLSPDIYLSGSPVTYGIKTGKFTTTTDMAVLTGCSVDYSITKRFKFNTGLKTSLSTNSDIPVLIFAVVGSKINL